MKKYSIILLLPILIFSGIYAQRIRSKIQLAKGRAKLEAKIQLTYKLLSETAAKKEKSMGEVAVISQQIKLRDELIKALEAEIAELENEIVELGNDIQTSEEQLGGLRKSYSVTAQIAYQSFTEENFWLAILSSESLSDAYYRIVYFQQFSKYRRQQIEGLTKTQQLLIEDTKELTLSIAEKTQLIEEKKAEVEKLSRSKTEQTFLIAELKGKEQNYREDLQLEKSQLRNIIESMDVAETAPATSSTNKNTHKSTTESSQKNKTTPAVTPNDATGILFEKQKGKLLFPIVGGRGVIIGKYGDTVDEYGNSVQNDGIYIRTPQGQEVRSIYDGKVTAVTKVPLSGTMVIVAHGKYRSVYANLRESNVSQGEVVKANQIIGVVRTDPRTDEAVLNFMLHKAPSTYLNPENWLRDE